MVGGRKEGRKGMHTLYPLALLLMSSTLPWMLSMGLDCVGMFSSAVPAAVLSMGVDMIVCVVLGFNGWWVGGCCVVEERGLLTYFFLLR